jgi:hypothetical protein
MKFGQAINKLAQPLWRSMCFAIPFFIERCIPQTEVRREVDNLCSQFCILLDVVLRLSMRLGEEQYIHRLHGSRIAELELRLLA